MRVGRFSQTIDVAGVVEGAIRILCASLHLRHVEGKPGAASKEGQFRGTLGGIGENPGGLAREAQSSCERCKVLAVRAKAVQKDHGLSAGFALKFGHF